MSSLIHYVQRKSQQSVSDKRTQVPAAHGDSAIPPVYDHFFSSEAGASYHYDGGWNRKAMIAFAIASLFSVASVWAPGLSNLSGYSWIFGAMLGALLHYLLMRKSCATKSAEGTLSSRN